jgi:hypothetical protein
MYPRVLISSLAKQLQEYVKLRYGFSNKRSTTGVWPRDHYMILQRSTTGVCQASLWFLEQTVPACSAKVSCTNNPSCTMWFTKYVTKYDHKVWCHPHSTEHDTQPIVFLISKQVFHTGHVVAHVVLGCPLLRFGT